MSLSVTGFKTTNLVQGASARSVLAGISGSALVTVKAVKGSVQFAGPDSWGFTPIAVSAFTTNSDLDAFTLSQGESIEFVYREDGTGNLCFASANAAGTGDSVVSVFRRPL